MTTDKRIYAVNLHEADPAEIIQLEGIVRGVTSMKVSGGHETRHGEATAYHFFLEDNTGLAMVLACHELANLYCSVRDQQLFTTLKTSSETNTPIVVNGKKEQLDLPKPYLNAQKIVFKGDSYLMDGDSKIYMKQSFYMRYP